MTIGYALAYTSRGNSFQRSYDVFYLDENGVVKRLNIGNVPLGIAHLGILIARYQMANKGNNPNPISFRRPADFPDVAQFGHSGDNKIVSVFSELTSRELSAAVRSMMKTLRGE